MRVAFYQPSLPHYRVPFFDALGARDDFDVTVFCGKTSGSMETRPGSSFKVVEAPVTEHKWARGMLAQPAMTKTLDANEFDAAVLSWNARYTTLPLAILKGRRSGIPILLWGHGTSKRPGAIRDMIRNQYARSANAIVLYDNVTAGHFRNLSTFPSNKVYVAQNALDQSEIRSASRYWLEPQNKLADFQATHNIDPSRTIIFVSRLLELNRGEMLISVIKSLVADWPTARLVIVGDGPDRKRLEGVAVSQGVQDHVVFTGAIYDEAALAPWMLSSSLLCYPVNMGLSLLHAFGYGLPVVTSDNDACHGPEICALESGKNGLRYRHGDCEDMLRACREVFSSEQKQSAMSKAARKTVTQEFTIERMVDGFAEALHASVSAGKLMPQQRQAA